MNRREAKRLACAYVAAAIDGDIASGRLDPSVEIVSDIDVARVREALEELLQEVLRRGKCGLLPLDADNDADVDV